MAHVKKDDLFSTCTRKKIFSCKKIVLNSIELGDSQKGKPFLGPLMFHTQNEHIILGK